MAGMDNRTTTATRAITRRVFLAAAGVALVAAPGCAHAAPWFDLSSITAFFMGDQTVADDASADSDAAVPAPETLPADTAAPSTESPSADAYQRAVETLRQAVLDGRTDEVDLSDVRPTEQEFLAATDALEFEPRLMHWGRTSYTTSKGSDDVKRVTAFTLHYRVDETVLATYQADLDTAVTWLANQTDPAASTYDKALFVYDWLINNATYNHEVADSGNWDSLARTPLGPLLYADAVCSGYATAYQLVLEKLGIACDCVNSTAMNHIWNVVNIDGTYYHADLTWDDKDDDQGPRHFYFLVGEQTIARDHYGWDLHFDAPTDLDRPNVIRYSPDSCTLADAMRDVIYNGYAGVTADVLDFAVDNATFNDIMQGLCDNGDFWGINFTCTSCYNEDGTVTCFSFWYD